MAPSDDRSDLHEAGAGDATPFDPRAALADLRHRRSVELEQQAEQRLRDNWEAHYAKLDAPRRAWADLLMRQPWHWFCTLTFKPKHDGRGGGIHPEKARKAFALFLSTLNRELYGPRWYKPGNKARGGLVWANGTEFHKDGRVHFHALVACAQVDLNELARRLDWMDWWFEKFGIARIEPPDTQEDVCGYISKYVVKGGEVELSDNFGKVQPPSLFRLPGQETGLG